MDVISADSHVVESEDVFIGLPERFGDDAPRFTNAGTMKDSIVIPSKGPAGIRRPMGFAGLRVKEAEDFDRQKYRKPDVDDISTPENQAILEKGYDGLRAGIRDGAYRHADQEIDGIKAEFLDAGFFGLFAFYDPELLVACQKNYNDWLHDYATSANGRLFGLAAIPMQNPEAAVFELDRVIKMGYRGGCIPCTSPHDRPYFDLSYEPIWTLAEEAGFPLSMHVGTNSYVPKEFRVTHHRPDSVFDYGNSPSTIQRTLVELMCRGVCERHPNLKLLVSEFNAGWIAFWLNRIEQGLHRDARFKMDEFTGERPQEVWERQFWATIEDDRPALLTREIIGVKNLMWGSDYPHVDSTWPCSLNVIEEIFEGIPDADRQAITHDNVRELYDITI